VTALALVAGALLAAVAVAAAYHARRPRVTARHLLVPFTAGALDPAVLDAAIRVAKAEDATLVPAYLVVVPLCYAEDSALTREVELAMPLLEAVEHAALKAGVPVDARIEKGRTATHALRRLWQVERFDRMIAPAPSRANGGGSTAGFTPKELTWILTAAPFETMVLKPAPAEDGRDAAAGRRAARIAG
jgi:hypothetical protein